MELLLERDINLRSVIKQSVTFSQDYLYESILAMVKEDNEKRRPIRIKENNIKTLLDLLNEKFLIVAQEATKKWTVEEVAETAHLIRIACEISCNEVNQLSLLDDEDLYKNTIGALKTIHLAHKAKSLREQEPKNDPDPSNGNLAALKRDLVRLVSNLTYNRPHLQLLASKIDAVPLILDLHTLDKNNPFIREWAICATRNLLHNCQENMKIARGMQNLNISSDPELLERLNLEIRNGKLIPKGSP